MFKAFVENTPDLIARFTRDLRREYVNPAIERLTGMPASALTGKTLSELNFEPRFSAQIEAAVTDAFEKEAETTLEVLLPSSEGELVFHLRIVPERGLDGAVVSALVISRDITSIRRDQERLRALTREIELLLASTYEGICAVDLSGTCTLVNASAAAMFGYAPQEITGRNLHELVHGRHEDGTPYPAEDCPMAKVVADGQAVRVLREVLWRKDGVSFPAEIFSSPIFGDDGELRGAVYSFLDVTEREKMQSELDHANRLAALGRVASAMSHEFNNVLMGIQPFAEVLLRMSGEAKAANAANRIIESVRRGREITEDLRSFTRPAPPEKTPTDVRAWLSESIAGLEALLPPNVRLEVDIAHAGGTMDVDPARIRKALTNIVLNARDAIGNAHGSIAVSAKITYDRERLQSDAPFLHLSVRDDGPGIEPQNLARLFEPFYTTRKAGRGLGLAIARQIVTLHGGQLFVDSEPGKGTTVHVFLPASAGSRVLWPVEERKAPMGGRWPETVLLVEDDETVASGVVALLEDEKVHVRLAADGAEALAILREFRPQALVIDINLPDCSGFDLYERITADIAPYPVVFASGHADASRLESLRTPAGVRMLTKPYAIDTLLTTLESLAPATR